MTELVVCFHVLNIVIGQYTIIIDLSESNQSAHVLLTSTVKLQSLIFLHHTMHQPSIHMVSFNVQFYQTHKLI